MSLGFGPPQVDQLGQPGGLAVGKVRALRGIGAEVVQLPRLGVEIITLVVLRDCFPPAAVTLGDQRPAAGVLEVLQRVRCRGRRILEHGDERVSGDRHLVDSPVGVGWRDTKQFVDRRDDVGDVDELRPLRAGLVGTEPVGPVHDHRHMHTTLVGVLLVPPKR